MSHQKLKRHCGFRLGSSLLATLASFGLLKPLSVTEAVTLLHSQTPSSSLGCYCDDGQERAPGPFLHSLPPCEVQPTVMAQPDRLFGKACHLQEKINMPTNSSESNNHHVAKAPNALGEGNFWPGCTGAVPELGPKQNSHAQKNRHPNYFLQKYLGFFHLKVR